jgi:hypothetical protein
MALRSLQWTFPEPLFCILHSTFCIHGAAPRPTPGRPHTAWLAAKRPSQICECRMKPAECQAAAAYPSAIQMTHRRKRRKRRTTERSTGLWLIGDNLSNNDHSKHTRRSMPAPYFCCLRLLLSNPRSIATPQARSSAFYILNSTFERGRPKPPQSHINATSKPPQCVLLANRLRP